MLHKICILSREMFLNTNRCCLFERTILSVSTLTKKLVTCYMLHVTCFGNTDCSHFNPSCDVSKRNALGTTGSGESVV